MSSDSTAWVPRHLYPFRSHFREVEGHEVHHVDEGDGPPILFLHGNPTWSFLYRNIVAELRDSFRCIALDYPGFGLSTSRLERPLSPGELAGVVEAFVLDLDLQGVTLMGQDWGGPIGLRVATRQPDRFAGVVLGNTWAWPLNGDLHFEVFARVMGSPIAGWWIRNANAFVNVMLPLGTLHRLPREVMDAYRRPFRGRAARKPTSVLPRELLRSRTFMQELSGALPAITHLPALFTWGTQDFALRSSVELRRFQELFPDHEVVELNAKHFFQEDAPHETAHAIRTWMRSRVMTGASGGRA